MTEKTYFQPLYEIARHLNQEFTLEAALRKALEKTIEVLGLDSGWIWLVQPDKKSVYLAASYQLPSALSRHPERLSGWCYCIEKYLSSKLARPSNISEIACSRLKNLPEIADSMKFHATVPIEGNGEKLGILNLLHSDTRQLDQQQLTILQTISELIAMAIQRTRAQLAHQPPPAEQQQDVHKIVSQLIQPKLAQMSSQLEDDETNSALLQQIQELQQQLGIIQKEQQQLKKTPAAASIRYPNSPLTSREREVLQWVKQGLTNRQIAEQLFISERTIKFHLTAILSKLDAQTRTEAVDVAIQRGLLSWQ